MAKTYTLVFGAGDPRQYSGLSPTMLIFVNAATGATVAPPSVSEAFTPTCGIYKFTWGTTTPIAFLCDAATTSPGTQGRYVYGQIDPADRSDEYGTSIVAFGATLFGQGVTNIALGTTAVAIGTTVVGYGVTNIALGTSALAIGTTLVGYGVSNLAVGTTLIGYGVSGLALGVSNLALGVSNLAQGSTNLGYGISIYAQVQNIGTTLVAVGNSLSVIGTSLSVIVPAIGTTASSFGDSTTDPGTLFGYLKRIQENLEGDSTFVKLTGAWSIYDRSGATLLAAKTIANNSSQVIKS